MIEQKELTVLKTHVSKLETQVNSVTIESQENYAEAIDLVAKLKETGSQIKNRKELITKPLNEALRNARELFRPIEDQFAMAENIIKRKLLDYKRKIDEAARKKEEALAARVEKGTMKMETAEKKLDTIERVDNTTHGNSGAVQIRTIKKVRITNDADIPREYLVPDMVKIRRDALGGVKIQGVEVYDEDSIASYHASTRDYADQLNPSQKSSKK